MSEIPQGLYYTKKHEYLKPTKEPNVFLVGITDYAQEELGDIVFLELPEIGDRFGKLDVFGTIEAVKAVSDLYSPVGGEITAVNSTLDQDPALVNTDPYGDGWMIRMKVDDPDSLSDLLDQEAYHLLVE